MVRFKVLYMNCASEDVYKIIRSQLPECLQLVTLNADDSNERMEKVKDADFILIANAKLTGEMIRAGKKLKLIQHQGVGYDSIDVKAATEHGVEVCLTPEGTSVGVSEHVVLLILGIYKKVVKAYNALLEGKFLQWELRYDSFEIFNKTVGLIGFGRIAREVAKRLNAFDARLLFYDEFVKMSEVEQKSLNVKQVVSLEEMLGQSDIISIHVPLTKDTRGMINKEIFEMMKTNAILINTARGEIINEGDLCEALLNKRIAAAGLDVFNEEPLSKESPLLKLDNVLLSPHIAAGTKDALITKMKAAFENMVRVLDEKKPINSVNKADVVSIKRKA